MKSRASSRAIRLGCLTLALIFAASAPAAAAASGASTRKDETVYVNLDASGAVQGVTVSDWLHAGGNTARISDRSDLRDIRNIKSSEEPAQNSDALTWPANGSADGADIYYEGKSSKSPPLSVSVSYTLNGRTVSPQEIAGKSGRATITISLKNTDAHTVTAGGKDVVMYTPMTAVVATALPSDTFRNVTVSKGKVISDGNNQFVTFLAVPGLSESLDLKNCGVDGLNSLDLPEELEIDADVTDFTLGPIAVAATPELPDSGDLGEGGSLDDLRADLDKLGAMQDDIEKADPDRDIRSLFTDPDRTAAARLLVDDVFDFYSLDTAAVDTLPQYVTDKNIKLYDRVTSDLDKADLKYLLDNKVIRGLDSRMTDENAEKAKTLLNDYDELQTLSMGKFNRMLKVMNRYDRDYDHLDDVFKDARRLLNRLDEDDVDTLDALSSSAVRSSLSDTLESMSGLNKTLTAVGLSADSIELEDEDVEALLNSIASRKLAPLTMAIANLGQQGGGNINVAQLFDLLSGQDLGQPELEAELTQQLLAAFLQADPGASVSVSSLASLKPTDNLSEEELQQIAAAIAKQPGGNESLPVSVLLEALPNFNLSEGAINDLQSQIIPIVLTQNSDATIPTETVSNILSDELENQTNSIASQLTPELNGLLPSSSALDSSLKKELGGDYSSRLTDALSHMGSLKGSLDDLQDDLDDLDEVDEDDLENDLDDLEDLLLDKDDMDYLIGWVNRLKGMKSDMDGNSENLSVLRDLIALNDDPKIKTARSLYPALQADLDEARPILDSLKEKLDGPAVNASLHKLPRTTATLLKAERDIRNNRAIMDSFRLATGPETVSSFRDTFSTLDEFTQKGTADKITELLDRKDAYAALSDRYGIFTEAADGAETSLKFVFKTAEIKEPEAKAEPLPAAQDEAQDGSGGSFWDRVRSAFSKAANTVSHLF